MVFPSHGQLSATNTSNMSGFSFNFQIDGQPGPAPTDLPVQRTAHTTGDAETIPAHEIWPPSGGNPFAAAQEVYLTPSCSVFVRVSLKSFR